MKSTKKNIDIKNEKNQKIFKTLRIAVFGVLIAIVICLGINFNTLSKRCTYDSVESMKSDLQGTWVLNSDDFRKIQITINDGKITYITTSKKTIYKEITQWDPEHGKFVASNNIEYIVNKDGSLLDGKDRFTKTRQN